MLASLHFIRRALGLIWAASGRWMVAWATLSLLLGILPAASVFLTKWFVDALARAVGGGFSWERAQLVLLPACLVLAVMIAQRILGGVNDWVSTGQTQAVQDYIRSLIQDKAATIDFSFFESPEYQDQFLQANSQASTRTLGLLKNLSGLAQSTVTFVSISLILTRYGFWLPLALLGSSVPAFLVLLNQNRRFHAWWTASTADRRWSNYLDNVLTSQGAAAEVRINDLSGYLSAKFRGILTRMRREQLSLLRQKIISRFVAGFIGLGATGLAMGWIVWRAMKGHATLGDLALFYQSINQSQTLATTLLSNMGEIHTNVLFLEQVFAYLDKDNLIKEPADPVDFPPVLKDGIRFEGASFTYPDSARPAIDQFQLHVPAGKVVAIVGENGSGKSTLIKLLCRFYDPAQGRITVDGIDLRELSLRDLRRQIAVMFQFPVRYHLTVAQNIEVGDLHGKHGPEQVQAAAKGAGAHEFIARLPNGYENLLGRSFEDSAELSGGEWQRLALARAFLRQAEIVVLDEPTSFMDSWAENDWLKRFRNLVRGRTALIITHRFTTAMQADIIHVMDAGRIIESGTHAELLRLGGKYAASWKKQVEAGAGG